MFGPSRPIDWLLVLLASVSLGCTAPRRLVWPTEVRAAAERGPDIRPPEAWAPAPAAEVFHARGWFVLAESWNRDPDAGPVGHCWHGEVRTVGEAGGDVTPSDFHEHGLMGFVMRQPQRRDGLELYADDRHFVACEPEADVSAAVAGLAEECAAFGEALEELMPDLARRATRVHMRMDAIELGLDIRFEAPAGTLSIDALSRRLVARGFRGEAAPRMGDPPTMLRSDDHWHVRVTLPAQGATETRVLARTRVPRRPMCGPPPRPAPAPL